MISATCGARRPMPTSPRLPAPPLEIIAATPSANGRLLLRLQGAVHHPVAGALRHVDPGVALLVALRGAGARGVRGLAVVLARLRDAEALFVLELGRRRRPGLGRGKEREREGGDHRGCDHELHLVHHGSPCGEALTTDGPRPTIRRARPLDTGTSRPGSRKWWPSVRVGMSPWRKHFVANLRLARPCPTTCGQLRGGPHAR